MPGVARVRVIGAELADLVCEKGEGSLSRPLEPLEFALMAAEGVRLRLTERMARHTVVWNRDRHDGACRQSRRENASLAATMPFNAAGKPA